MTHDEAVTLLGQVYASEPTYVAAKTAGNTEQTTHDDAIIVGSWIPQIKDAGVTEDLALRSQVLGQMKMDAVETMATLDGDRAQLDQDLFNDKIKQPDWAAQKADIDANQTRLTDWADHIQTVIEGSPTWPL